MRHPSSAPRAVAAALALALLPALPSAQAPARPRPTFVRGVTLGLPAADGAVATASLVLRDGRIAAVLAADAPPPPAHAIVEGAGFVALPAFVDAWSVQGVATPEPTKDRDKPVDVSSDVRVDMRLANRKGIQPSFRAVEALALEDKRLAALREAGFGWTHVAPSRQLLAGRSVLAATRDAAMRDLVVAADVYSCASFRASGSGYPSTLMGYIAQLRQFLLDAEWYAELVERHAAGRPGTRPPYDAELEAGLALLAGESTLLCHVETARDARRWFGLADQFGLRIAFVGGRDLWKIADELAARDVPVVLTLDWGDEVDDPADEEGSETAVEDDAEEGEEGEPERVWEYQEPYGVRAERRRLWEEGRDCALRLAEANVRFAFGTADAKPADLRKKVRELVEAGLPTDVALDALTVGGAALVGGDGRLGELAVGADATFVLWTGDPFTRKKAAPAWIFVDGFGQDFDAEPLPPVDEGSGSEEGGPAEGVDPTGRWELVFEDNDFGPQSAVIELHMDDDGELSGTIEMANPLDGTPITAKVDGAVEGRTIEWSFEFALAGEKIETTGRATLEDDVLSGEATSTNPWSQEPLERDFSGSRVPEEVQR